VIGRCVARGFTFEEIDRMTLPQVLFAADGGKHEPARYDFATYEEFAGWRKRR
jgi:hypothetical protein